ncbi:secreted Zn-dependent insulinase-like peptidase [Tamilnaduibacter salinus]|uniref:Protease 3 n=1 Tax=Tamilnaduibacter salinus TaxID=1484056 RepID=A0A2U1CVF8_9GAMM|nr:insulinase family protein [Tamilnaduibacter salinus]PVY75480.1 secreted Zn-dependent insulinase-like peptidase [Tamilnaduibacter salinus]
MLRDPSLRFRLFPLVAVLCLGLAISQAVGATTPIKSPNDDNRYRALTLENGLDVLLISDPDTDKAAAALDIEVGSGDDPVDRAGLAHFLEHMLFLGTEKYPDPGEYQQFISSHGGSHNAFTAFQDTNYFFDIQPDSLEPALDRFAQQFTAPLFNNDLVEREKKAVHSEYSSGLKSDSRRFQSARKAVTNPAHAFSQFAVGNKKTLVSNEETNLRDELIEFWENHYSANLMTLVVYGQQSLDELAAMVRPRFSTIKNRELTKARHDAPLFEPGTLPAELTVQAEKEVRRLTLAFPMPSLEAEYADKPASYIANLLGHEGPGSLLNVLREANLAESLSAGLGQDLGAETTFEITIGLTPQGVQRRQRIVDLTFDAIRQIRQSGIQERYFRELKQLNEISFRFRDKPDPRQQVTHLAMRLHDVAAEDVLQAPWMQEQYTPEKYRHVLSHLTPDNILIAVLSPTALPDDTTTTQWYRTPYQFTTLEPGDVTGQASQALASQLALPAPNPFIPEDLSLVDGATMDHPEPLTTDGPTTLWYARDTSFDVPRASVYLSLRSPLVRNTARNAVLTDLLVENIQDRINAYAYPARLAGLDYSVYSHLRGITIRVGGYNDKLHVLLRRILSNLASPSVQKDRFEVNRKALIDSLRNQRRQKPVQQASRAMQEALIDGVWSIQSRLEAAQSLTADDLRSYASEYLRRLDPVMLAHGNISKAAALNLHGQARALLLGDSERVDVPRGGIHALPKGLSNVSLNVGHPDVGYALYLQGQSTAYPVRARYRVLAQMVGSPFYQSLRTDQQLGYIVSASSWEILETPGLGMLIQSPSATPEAIDQAVNEFLSDFTSTLVGFSEKDVSREKNAVISRLREKDRQLSERSERYWREIDRGETGFDSREQLIDAVRSVEKSELLSAWKETIQPRKRALRVKAAKTLETDRSVIEALQDAPFVY